MHGFECKNAHVSRFASCSSIVAALVLFAGCATDRYGEFEPKGELAPSTGTAFASYRPAMQHHDGYAMAYEWQQANPRVVADATKREVLASFVESDAAADALLSKVGTSYDGDPVVLTQIAAVTQMVMRPECRKCPKTATRRTVWISALKRRRASTDDGYVRTFCDQQLRLCR